METKPQSATATGSDSVLGTRERVVRAASRLLQQQGYEGTGIKLIAREAGATLGSVYHFFPGGKEELAVAAIQHGGEEFAEALSAALATADDPAVAVENCAKHFAAALRESGWTDGCPVTSTALETLGRAPRIQEACSTALHRWETIMAEKLRASGFAEVAALDLAGTLIATLEGAEVTAQVYRSEQPLVTAGRHLGQLVRACRPVATAAPSQERTDQ